MDPVPLRSAGTMKSGRTSVAANPAAPTLEDHFSESTTTAALDQLHGCYSYRSEHPFSRDCCSPTNGPAQEPRPPGEDAQWSTEGCNAGASAHVRREHPLPHSPPFQYWALPQILCQALRSRSPAAPSPPATLTLCGDLGRHAGPEQGAAGCRGGEGALAAAAGSRTDCCQG